MRAVLFAACRHIMTSDGEVQGYRNGLLSDAPSSHHAEIAVADFLKDVRHVKRLTQWGVYSTIFATLPAYRFLLGFSLTQLLVGLAVGLIIATTAIEGAFHEMFKLRKRSAYPGAVALQLGSLPTFDAACEGMATIIDGLLHLRGSFLALHNDSGFLCLVALSNLNRVDADRCLRLGAACIDRALTDREPVHFHPSNDLIAEAVMAPGEQIVFVPVRSFQKVIGVLGLLADDSNGDLRDRELLASLGTALGVSLENLRQRDELRTLAAVDELTKVYNRRYFFDQLDREISAARRYATSVSVLIYDLDDLKKLNDNFGHGLGDEALRTLAQRLVRYSRASDIVARLGGDEFAVILPRTDGAGAAEISRRLRTSVESEVLVAAPGRHLRIAVSGGFASFPEDADDAGALLRQADGHMYAAKAARSAGRRRST
jgi:diguanylate cyclase (GGDEF)-like protein